MGLCGRCLSEFLDWREVAFTLRKFSHVCIFNPALCSLLSYSPLLPLLPFSLVQLSTLPPFRPFPVVNKYTVYTYTV
jgi:hypothetical protein